jgi:hypothetical protein
MAREHNIAGALADLKSALDTAVSRIGFLILLDVV